MGGNRKRAFSVLFCFCHKTDIILNGVTLKPASHLQLLRPGSDGCVFKEKGEGAWGGDTELLCRWHRRGLDLGHMHDALWLTVACSHLGDAPVGSLVSHPLGMHASPGAPC